MERKSLIILDRDGVINHDSDDYIKSVDEWHAIDGSIEAIAKLKQSGFKVAIATNQSGIGRGYYSFEAFQAMHQKMLGLLQAIDPKLNIDQIEHCPHTPDDHCDCRKPKAGMLNAILKQQCIDPKDCYFVGDTLSDMSAAKAADCDFVLVKTGKGERIIEQVTADPANKDLAIFDNLAQFTDSLLQQHV